MTNELSTEHQDQYAFGYQPGVQKYLQLHTVERCAAFLTPRLTSGMSLLDAGCGPGTITVGLAPIVAPGRLVAVDISPDEVATTAAALAAAGHDNARAQGASILELPFEDASFDAVFSHAVIDYLPDPQAAVVELVRVLKPGGVIGMRSVNNDRSIVGPENPLIERGVELFRRVANSFGGDMCRGRLLGGMFKEAGLERIFAQPSYECARSQEEWAHYCDAFAGCFDGTTIAEVSIREGWATQQDCDDIVAAFRAFGTDSSNCFALAWGEAVAYKPA